MSTQFSTDELYQQLQSNQITWLEFMHQSEYSEEYSAWCKDTGLIPMSSSAVKKYLDRPPELRQEFLKEYVLTHHFPDSDNKLMQSISR